MKPGEYRRDGELLVIAVDRDWALVQDIYLKSVYLAHRCEDLEDASWLDGILTSDAEASLCNGCKIKVTRRVRALGRLIKL